MKVPLVGERRALQGERRERALTSDHRPRVGAGGWVHADFSCVHTKVGMQPWRTSLSYLMMIAVA